MRDFIPWVRPKSSQPPDSEEEEEEEMTGLLDCYAARMRKLQEDATRGEIAAPDQTTGSSRPTTGDSSEEQAIIIPGSPETRSKDRLLCCLGGVGGGRSDTVHASNDPSSCSSWKLVGQVRVYPYWVEEVAASRSDTDEFLSPCS